MINVDISSSPSTATKKVVDPAAGKRRVIHLARRIGMIACRETLGGSAWWGFDQVWDETPVGFQGNAATHHGDSVGKQPWVCSKSGMATSRHPWESSTQQEQWLIIWSEDSTEGMCKKWLTPKSIGLHLSWHLHTGSLIAKSYVF